MKKYRCYYRDDFREVYDAMSMQDEHGDWYRVEDVDARIAELENALRSIAQYATRQSSTDAKVMADIARAALATAS